MADRLVRLIGDREVAKMLGVSVSTVRRLAERGPTRSGGADIRRAGPVWVGSMRRWDPERVAAVVRG